MLMQGLSVPSLTVLNRFIPRPVHVVTPPLHYQRNWGYRKADEIGILRYSFSGSIERVEGKKKEVTRQKSYPDRFGSQ